MDGEAEYKIMTFSGICLTKKNRQTNRYGYDAH